MKNTKNSIKLAVLLLLATNFSNINAMEDEEQQNNDNQRAILSFFYQNVLEAAKATNATYKLNGKEARFNQDFKDILDRSLAAVKVNLELQKFRNTEQKKPADK